MEKEIKMKKLVIVSLTFIALILCLSVAVYFIFTQSPGGKRYYVIEVKDGDTFVLDNGEIVRLLCVDTPEKNSEGYENATLFLSELILMKEVSLENPENFSFQKQDIYGRSLYFVYLKGDDGSDVLVNKELILNNFSIIYNFNNTADICRDFMGLQS